MPITKSWKGFELRMAKRFGNCTRGTNRRRWRRLLHADIFRSMQAAQECTQWLTEAVSNAVRNATECRVGIALIKRNGRSMLDEDTLVVMRLKDFESMCGEG